MTDSLDTLVQQQPERLTMIPERPVSGLQSSSRSAGSGCPHVQAKFLQVDGRRFHIRGVSYGTFGESAPGVPFPPPEVVQRDFAMMRAIGLNTVRLYDVPPIWLLDLAAEEDLRVILGVPWEQHLCLDRAGRRQVAQQVYQVGRTHGRHPAVLIYCVGNEIPTQIVRWYGKELTERFIHDLCAAARDAAPDALITYINYPSTEYLELPFLDLIGFNVYLHDQRAFQSYLARLQLLAGDRPLFLGELGFDSLRHGLKGQARLLQAQLRDVFDYGLCGAVVFTWTDDWFRGGHQVTDWAFGLVDRARQPKLAYHALGETLAQTPFRRDWRWPRVSVVIAAYNAAATLDDCLAALTRLTYPDYEVIVVNDGSTDATGDIAEKYATIDPRLRVIHTANGGLGVARNVGLAEARGEIVAYTDADCRADPDWLYYLALTLINKPVVGVGGPNLVPPDDGWVARCVGQAPGGPTHILISDEVAEHIPGCNMAFWKWALDGLGGFNPIYRQAGDDVDVCWRLQARGYGLGFSPVAIVWHHRRNSVRAYLKQQAGYGRAEALLERVHPGKFNGLGQVRWSGRIYGLPLLVPLLARPRVYQGVFGSALFQSLYQPAPGWLAYLHQTPEWYALLGLLVLLSAFAPWLLLVPVGVLALQTIQVLRAAAVAQVEPGLSRPERWKRRGLIALLHFLQPLARAWGRLRGGLGPFRLAGAPPGDGATPADLPVRLHHGLWRRLTLAFWGQAGQEKDAFLKRLMERLQAGRCVTNPNSGWEAWDLRVTQGLVAGAVLLAAVEDHGGPKRLLRLRVRFETPRWLAVGLLALAALVAVGVGQLSATGALLGLALPLAMGAWIIWQRARLVARLRWAARQVAEEMEMWELS
jgi:glycosyltransferase involved in cell wall biosynthesis